MSSERGCKAGVSLTLGASVSPHYGVGKEALVVAMEVYEQSPVNEMRTASAKKPAPGTYSRCSCECPRISNAYTSIQKVLAG